jgi:tetratricopeptide (TPR) repeat protein
MKWLALDKEEDHMKKNLTLIVLLFFVASAYAASAMKLWQKGKNAYDKKEYSEAISYFKKSAEADPQDGETFRWLGHAYYENRQYQDAVDALKQAVSLPHNKEVEQESWLWMSEGFRQLGQWDAAISSRKKYIELKPEDDNGFLVLANLYNWNEQFDEAITAAKRAIELKPDNAYANYCLGYGCRMKKQYDEAFDAIKKAMAIDPANGLYFYEMGNLFWVKKDYSGALEALKKADKLQPDDMKITFGIAAAYRVMGKYDDALIATNNAIALQPVSGDPKDTANFFAIRSDINKRKSNLEAALQDAEKAYSLDSANSLAQWALGAAYFDRGQYDESIKLLSQVKDIPNAQVLEATANAKQGKVKEAKNIYFAIPREDLSQKNIPLMDDRRTLLQTFKPHVGEYRIKARSLEEQGKYQEALFELSEALPIADETEAQAIQGSIFAILRKAPSLAGALPEEARRCVLRAEMLVKEGDFEKAAGEYMKAIRIAPHAARLYFNSAVVYAELKKYPEAIRQMNVYLEAVPDAPDARAAKDEIYKWEFMMEKGK